GALREFATTQIADCGGPVAVVAPPLRHLAGGAQLCGPAVTVWTKPGGTLYVLKAVDLITAGDVLVVDGGGAGVRDGRPSGDGIEPGTGTGSGRLAAGTAASAGTGSQPDGRGNCGR
ncbi:MAG TPA: hypothetical protein VFQ68_09705, partial [Streptosporangiaceae bacterium]|nr:hypothetical protein [Streptosporangiaceae bacterium]